MKPCNKKDNFIKFCKKKGLESILFICVSTTKYNKQLQIYNAMQIENILHLVCKNFTLKACDAIPIYIFLCFKAKSCAIKI